MKFLLLLTSVLCVALIVSARPTDEPTEQETSPEASQDEGTDTTDSDVAEGDTDTAEGDTDGTGESEQDDSGADDAEGEDDTADADNTEGDDDEDSTDGEENGDDATAGDGGNNGEGGAKETARNTYRQVHKLLKKIMKVNMKDRYLKSYVVARLQERLMNPTIDLVNTIEKYSKIKSCFSSLEKDVQALVKESEKSYQECKKEANNGNCGTEGTRELDESLIDQEQDLADCIVDKRDAE